MLKIPVKITQNQLSFSSLFAVYEALQKAFGTQSVVLLESLSGPSRDVCSSIVAFNPILTLSVTGTMVEFSGNSYLIDRATQELINLAILQKTNGRLELNTEEDMWRLLRGLRDLFVVDNNSNTSFSFGLLGYFGYDVARSIEKLPLRITQNSLEPTLVVSIFQSVITLDLKHGNATLKSSCADSYWQSVDVKEIWTLLSDVIDDTAEENEFPTVPEPIKIHHLMKQTKFIENVEKALEYIATGDIYQVQLGQEISIETDASPIKVYQRLRARNPSPYMYLMPVGDLTLIGASPESFIQISGGVITMRPIAGTIRRGETPEKDKELIKQLQTDEKELAEHLMLVDLCRNDIGRVCQPNTLEVSEFCIVEGYSHVHHLVSNVTGTLMHGIDVFDAIAATFPAGTMTGAPKVRAMEIIEELETTRRGVYAGSVGVIDFSGYTNMALCIRSAVQRSGKYSIRASAGVVSDSVAVNELRETQHKMGVTYWAITGEEFNNESLYD
jgi:anthranilate/para-aminobenzoate synthase component I